MQGFAVGRECRHLGIQAFPFEDFHGSRVNLAKRRKEHTFCAVAIFAYFEGKFGSRPCRPSTGGRVVHQIPDLYNLVRLKVSKECKQALHCPLILIGNLGVGDHDGSYQ